MVISAPSRIERLFGSHLFFRLWCSQAISSLGDWIGFAALTAIATRLGGSQEGFAVVVVIGVRLIPSLIFGPLAGVLVDKFDRKRLMVFCDLGRAATVATLPFVNAIWQLVIASFVLEIFTILWSPAKEATVPNIVPKSFYARANSLSLIAAYGMFVPGLVVFSILSRVADWIGTTEVWVFPTTNESLALYVDALSYFVSALTIALLAIPRYARGKEPDKQTAEQRQESEAKSKRASLKETLNEVREGWRFIGQDLTVRSVMVGLGAGLFGGAMIVPLGAIFARDVLQGGNAAFGALQAAMGVGVGVGMFLLSLVLKRFPPERGFWRAVAGAGVCLVGAASMFSTVPAMLFVFGLGLCAGAVYVLGFTILQTAVDDELRGRTFSALYVMARLCILLSFVVAPLLSDLFDALSDSLVDRSVDVFGVTLNLPGVRLALWLGGLIMVVAGFAAHRGLKRAYHLQVARHAATNSEEQHAR